MANIVVYALAAAYAADARNLPAVCPRGHTLVARDYSKFAAVAGRADQIEHGSPTVFLLVADASSLTGDETAALTALQGDYAQAAAFQIRKNDDGTTKNYVASAAVMVDSAIRIANTNRAPTVANALVDQAGEEEVALTPYAFAANSFADADGNNDTLTYSATLTSGSALPAWLTFTPATRTFAGTPAAASAATYAIRVKATDRAGAFVTDDFNLVVAPAE